MEEECIHISGGTIIQEYDNSLRLVLCRKCNQVYIDDTICIRLKGGLKMQIEGMKET